MNFAQKLDEIIKKNNSLLCVGLDPDLDKLPKHMLSKNDPIFEFNKSIIDATHDLVCAYKPNIAFYEAYGIEGLQSLKKTLEYLQEKHPEIPIVLDAKRGDIGSTNKGYVQFIFEYLKVDAVTLHPYLGSEALAPFLERRDKGCIILCRTSNTGAGEFQDLVFDNEPLYIHVAKKVVSDWNKNNNCLLVVGATYPEELKKVRDIASDMSFLVPGIGAQGGDIEKTVRAGLNTQKKGMIISSSKGIIYASSDKDFAKKAALEAKQLKTIINSYRI